MTSEPFPTTPTPPPSPPRPGAESRSWKTWALGIFLMLLCAGAIGSIISYWPHYESKQVTLRTPSGERDTIVTTTPVMSDTVELRRLAFGWPDSTSRARGGPPRFYARRVVFTVAAERRYLILAVLAGVLGAFIHMATSFAAFVGAGALRASWNWWYVLRPFIGGALALGVYFLLRAGLIVGSSAVDTVSPFGVAAICFLIGMFSKQAARKLEVVLDFVLGLEKDDLPHKLSDKT